MTSASSELARRDHVSLEDIAQLPLIGWRADADHAQIVDLFTGLPHRPRFPYRFDDNPTLQGCVAAGLAYALLPWLTLDPGTPVPGWSWWYRRSNRDTWWPCGTRTCTGRPRRRRSSTPPPTA